MIEIPECDHGLLRRRNHRTWNEWEWIEDARGNRWCTYCLNEGLLPKHTGLSGSLSFMNLRAEGYGLASESLWELLELRNGCCHLCGSKLHTFHIDHDHSCCPAGLGTYLKSQPKGCGKCVRGVLCPSCNARLGRHGDSSESLKSKGSTEWWFGKAIEYLQAYEEIRDAR